MPQGNPFRGSSAVDVSASKIPTTANALGDRRFLIWLLENKLPLAVSFLWILVLGAYGVGYFARLDAESSSRLLPTADILFFAFAVAGPVAMIWIVVFMLNRAERLTSAITDQSESALALATTISTLNDSVDALAAGTTARMEEACARMERDTQNSAKSLGKALDDISTKIDTTILDSVIMLDKSNRDRLHQVEAVLAAERSAFADRLDSDAQQMSRKIEESAADTKTRLDQAIEQAMAQHETRLAEVNKHLEAALGELSEQVTASVNDRTKTIDEGFQRQQSVLDSTVEAARKSIDEGMQRHQSALDITVESTRKAIDDGMHRHQSTLDETVEIARKSIEDGMQRHQSVLDTTVETTRKAIDEGMHRHQSALDETAESTRKAVDEGIQRHQTALESTADSAKKAIDAGLLRQLSVLETTAEQTRSTVENDLVAPLSTVRQSLDETVGKLVANPPASAEDISELLGNTARDLIAPEREILVKSIERIEALEQQARTMLVQIDRSSRLNPALAPEGREDPAPLSLSPASRIDDLELPFDDLPRTAERSVLDWTAVIEVLDRTEPRPGNASAMKTASEDPDIVALMTAGEAIEKDLLDDGVFLEDLRPDHAPTSVWVRFIQGERGDAVRVLEGIDDDIASAIVRGKLRRTPGFRASALKFATLYINLLERAVEEIGADQRLVELAESRMGRAFIALAGPLGLFEQNHPKDTA